MGARNEEKARAAIEKLHAEGLGDKAGESQSNVIVKPTVSLLANGRV